MPQDNLTEKVSVNINSSTLSAIDLLVDNGYYSNRSDFINQALRESLDRNQSTLNRIIEQNTKGNPEPSNWFIGILNLSQNYLENLKAKNKKIRINGYGVLFLEKSCPDQLIYETIESIQVRGSVRCSDAVKQHYGIRS